MPDPAPYSRDYDFQSYQALNPTRPLPGVKLNIELEAIEDAIAGVISAVGDIRRSDGALQNGIVGVESLDPEISFALLIEQGLMLGAKASDPLFNDDGGALLPGNIYYSTTTGGFRVWTGSVWTPFVTPADGTITTAKLADGSVTTPKLADAAVTAAKLGLAAFPQSLAASADGPAWAELAAPQLNLRRGVFSMSGAATADDSAALASVLAQVNAHAATNNGATLEISRFHNIQGPLISYTNPIKAGVKIVGIGRDAGFNFTGSASYTALDLQGIGVGGTAHRIATVSLGVPQSYVTAITPTSLAAAGDIVMIASWIGTGTDRRYHIATTTDVNQGTGVCIFSPPLPYNIDSLVAASGCASYVVTNGGSGYTSTPTVTVSAPDLVGGVQALATAVVDTNPASPTYQKVTAVNLSWRGSGYTSPPTASISGGGGSGALVTVIAAPNTTITKLSTSRGVEISNLQFDASGAAGSVVALNAVFMEDAWLGGLRFRNFTTSGSSVGGWGYYRRGSLHDISLYRCGGVGGTSITMAAMTNAVGHNIVAELSTGFGLDFVGVSDCDFSGIRSTDATGRTLKIDGSCGNRFRGVRASGSLAGFTCLAVSGGSSYNQFDQVDVYYSGNYGIWLNGHDSSYNRFNQVLSNQNAAANIFVGADGGLSDIGNIFEQVDPRSYTSAASLSIVAGKGTRIQFSDPSFTLANLPAAADVGLGSLAWATNLGGGAGPVRSNGTSWQRNGFEGYEAQADTSATLTVLSSAVNQNWSTTLTANRTATLSGTGATKGGYFFIRRSALGAFWLAIVDGVSTNTIYTIPPSSTGFVKVVFDGTNWVVESSHAKEGYEVKADVSATLTPGQSAVNQNWATALTVARTVTLSATGANTGDYFWVRRSAGGAFPLSIVNGGGGAGTIAVLPYLGAAKCVFNGTDWVVEDLAVTPVSFQVSKSAGAGNQSIASATLEKITFTNVESNLGSYYDTTNSRWTPPAGQIRVSASASFAAGLVDQNFFGIYVYKNGAAFKTPAAGEASGTGVEVLSGTARDTANGTDYYEIWAIGNGAGAKTIAQNASTYFSGEWIGP